ncbi:GntR family transcriptional regulator [Streptococcus gallolyticus]|uniref:GntR family transcriptional regulator n=1 Tax=Streptococcus hepaticus TaxID=3349163 RepID=UPI001C93A45F|nr:GntR family transcriptional regulator [Streptococcus gallolyticus]MBY5042077.1 GntR family transcriptional regulator [Streptococcus gallolyticus]
MLDNSNKQPLYFQLFESLLSYIQNELKPNDKLPTEKEIGEEYAVSRMTVRLAMKELEKRGYIFRVQGKGSFVSQIKNEHSNTFLMLDLENHFDNTKQDDFSSVVFGYSLETANQKLQQQMRLSKGAKVLRIKVQHNLKDTAIATEDLVLKDDLFHNISPETIEKHTLDTILKEKNIRIKAIEEQYTLSPLGEKIAHHSKSEQVLTITKFVYDQDNNLVLISHQKLLTNKPIYKNFIWSN